MQGITACGGRLVERGTQDSDLKSPALETDDTGLDETGVFSPSCLLALAPHGECRLAQLLTQVP